jgi:hypothetical protein
MSKDIFYDKDIREPLFERDYNTIAEEIETYRKNRRKA